MNEQQQRGRNNKRRGKAIERTVRDRISKLLDNYFAFSIEEADEAVWRNPDNGSQLADVETVECFGSRNVDFGNAVIEVKSRQAPQPQWQRKAFQQAEEAARQTGKRPYVIVSYLEEDGKRHLYVMRRFSWIEKEYA